MAIEGKADAPGICVASICLNNEAASGVRSLTNTSIKRTRADHVCYISNLAKMHSHFPDWYVSRKLDRNIQEMCQAAFGGCIV